MFGLIPKEEQFFTLFREMGGIIVEGAERLKTMLDEYRDPAASAREIKDIEHRGDAKTHEIIRKLNKSFITPLDREDIYALASGLDDVLDLVDASAQKFIMFNVEEPTPEAKELAFLILQGCRTVARALEHMGGTFDHINEHCTEVNSLENEADRVCREAISRLFDEEKDPIRLIKWKEIYETLERATDKCEDAANILESVLVKNA